MKKIIFLLSLFLVLNHSFARPGKSKIPATIKSYVNLHYPNASRVHWLIHEGNFIVSLFNDETHVEICLNEQGEYVNSIKEISFYEQIPAKIQTKVDIRKLIYAEKLESRDGELFYIMEVALAKGKIEEIVFDAKGNEIKDHIADDNSKDGTQDILKF